MLVTTMDDVTAIEVAMVRGAMALTPTAVALLYEWEADKLYAYALRRVREPMDADDVVAETFRRAVEHLHRYERRDVPVPAWLAATGREQTGAHARHRRGMLAMIMRRYV